MNRTESACARGARSGDLFTPYQERAGSIRRRSIVKDEIRADFAAKNFDVVDVTMLPAKARANWPVQKLKAQAWTDQIQQKNCTAAIAADITVTTSWKCD